MLLIYILIILFICLLVYQVYLANYAIDSVMFYSKLMEGLENKETTSSITEDYNPNNSLILAQENAENIEVLKGKINALDDVNKKIDDIQRSVDTMQIQVDGLIKQQAEYAQELAGSTPPTITGTSELTVEDVEKSIQQE
jgi:hypothetical protein